MRKPFKAGEEIVCYNNGSRFTASVIGTHHSEGGIYVRNGNLDMLVHPKQCHRLVKKKRREIWICERHLSDLFINGSSNKFSVAAEKQTSDDIRFIEAKDKK